MIITSPTLKERRSGAYREAMWAIFVSFAHSLAVSSVCVRSVGVALSRGHGKYFFRGNVSVEAGMSFQLLQDRMCYAQSLLLNGGL